MPDSPFVHPRRVAFGDCDPARIFYAPRAIEYAVEAAEAWSGAVGKASWPELLARRGLSPLVEVVDCEYQRSLFASQVVRIRVEAEVSSGSGVALRATGQASEAGPGDEAFRARVELRFAPREEEAAPGPVGVAAGAAGPAVVAAGTAGFADAGAAAVPFTRSFRIRWGECGPAGTAYAPRIVDRAVEAAGEWYESCLGVTWLQQCQRGRGTPFVRIRCAFHRPLAAGDEVAMAVTVPRLGNASIGYRVEGRSAGRLAFEADMAACYITEEAGPPKAMPFPDELRRRIVEYQRTCQGARPAAPA